MNLVFLYPCNPLYKTQVDECYYDEYTLAKNTGLSVHVFDIEDIINSKISPVIANDVKIIYRGWMLDDKNYTQLAERFGNQLLTAKENYFYSHYLPNWYPDLKNFTMCSIVTTEEDASKQFQNFPDKKAFIKDFVKSLKTKKGSIVESVEDINLAISNMKHFRGFIEGGIVLREVVDLIPNSEVRFFVVNNVSYSPVEDSDKYNLVQEIVKRLIHKNLKFYSIDIATTASGKSILIEIGDGQVSDYVGWNLEKFISVLSKIAQI